MGRLCWGPGPKGERSGESAGRPHRYPAVDGGAPGGAPGEGRGDPPTLVRRWEFLPQDPQHSHSVGKATEAQRG